MKLHIRPYPPYRAGLGGQPFDLDVPDGSTLREVLVVLARRSRELEPMAAARSDEWLWGQLIVHVRGEMVLLDEALRDGDTLELLPPIAGGAEAPPYRGSSPKASCCRSTSAETTANAIATLSELAIP